MAQFTLPEDSKVIEGILHKPKQPSEISKKPEVEQKILEKSVKISKKPKIKSQILEKTDG